MRIPLPKAAFNSGKTMFSALISILGDVHPIDSLILARHAAEDNDAFDKNALLRAYLVKSMLKWLPYEAVQPSFLPPAVRSVPPASGGPTNIPPSVRYPSLILTG